jgi:hypothetical protein
MLVTTRMAARAAEHAHAADRCAREIVRFLTVSVVRSRRLMGNPFGVRGAWSACFFLLCMERIPLPNARRADSVVQKPVVPVWYGSPLCGKLVM